MIKQTSVVLYDEELKRSFGWKTDVWLDSTCFDGHILKLTD